MGNVFGYVLGSCKLHSKRVLAMLDSMDLAGKPALVGLVVGKALRMVLVDMVSGHTLVHMVSGHILADRALGKLHCLDQTQK